jgi:hypothetical protein
MFETGLESKEMLSGAFLSGIDTTGASFPQCPSSSKSHTS